MIRITINGDSTQFNSKIEIDPEYWEQKSQRAIAEPYLYINQEIVAIRNKIQRIYLDLSLKLQYISAQRLKESYLSNGKEMYITYQFKQQIKIFSTQGEKRISSNTKANYERTLTRLQYFLEKKYKKTDILIQKIDYYFLEDFFTFLKTEYNLSLNSASKYMKRFAAIMNYAYKTKVLQINPFDQYNFEGENIHRPCLTQVEIERIARKRFFTPRLNRTKDIFVFCCFTDVALMWSRLYIK